MIGGFRQWEDIDDPRRSRGPVPQEQNIPGLPAAKRILRRGTIKEGYYERENPQDKRIADALIQQKTAGSKASTDSEGSFAFLSRMKAALTGKSEANTAEQVLSAEIGRPISRDIANRARDYVEILGISPEKGLLIAETEVRKGINTLPPSLVKEIMESGELKPDLAAQNAVLAVSKGNLPEEAAAIKLRGEPFRSIGGRDLENLAAAEGAGRNLPGGRRNPLDKDIKEIVVDGYRVPVLVGAETERKKAPPTKNEKGKLVWPKGDDRYIREKPKPGQERGDYVMETPTVKTGEKVKARGEWTDWDRKRFDTRAAEVALIDPTTLVSGVRRSDPTVASDERSGKNKDVPRVDESLVRDLIGITPDNPSVVHGLSAAEDPSRRVEYVQMTLAEAVEDIRLNNRTPIKTLRQGEDTYFAKGEGGEVKEFLKYRAPDGNIYKTDIEVFAYNKQYPDHPELIDYRIGSNTEITNEGMREFNRLMKEVPGLENKTILANAKINDSAINRAQNALLQEGITEEWRSKYAAGDPNAKPIHDLMKAIARASTAQPSDSNPAPAYISSSRFSPEQFVDDGFGNKINKELGQYQYGSGTALAETYKDQIANYLRATPANPEVQAIRAKYQADPREAAANEMASSRPQDGATNSAQISQLNAPEPSPPASSDIPVRSYERFADEIGGEIGSPGQEYALRAMAQRIKARRGL